MFRDRVVSMEQTQEIGEKNIDLLAALATEALPGFTLSEHGLEHEQDLYVLTLTNPESNETRRVSFTRMVLSDANRLPAIVADAAAPVRGQIVDVIRGQAARPEILVSIRQLLTEEERTEAEEIDAEWRRKHEAALAARRAEDERRARERQKQKQAEDARRQAQRDRERRQKAAQGGGSGQPQQPGAQQGEGGGRRRRRRGRGGQRGGGPGGAPGPSGQPQAAQVQGQPRPPQARPQQPQQPRPAGVEPGAPRPEGGGGRRRRRRGRGRGGNAGGGAPPPPSVL
jgi:hypothetical protein